MEAEIKTTLSRDAALALFDRNCCSSSSGYDVIPEYRMVELFGEDVARQVDAAAAYDKPLDRRYFTIRVDVLTDADGEPSRMRLFDRAGFLYIVGQHNYSIVAARHAESHARVAIENAWAARLKEIDALDAAKPKAKRARKKTGGNTPAAAVQPSPQ